MEKLTWDYLGWKKFNPAIEIGDTQRDWNQTLMISLNQLNAQNFQTLHKNNIDGAYRNRLKINENLLDLIKDFEYTVINDGNITIGGMFEVEVDNNLSKDEILVSKEDRNKKTLVENIIKILNYEQSR